MARKRMISPEIWDSESFADLSILAKLIFIGMISNADDEGRGKAKASFIKSRLFPYDDSMRVADVEAALDEIAAKMSVTMYSYDGKEYYAFDNWKKWQKVDKPTPSTIRAFGEDCTTIRGTFGERSANVRGTLSPNRIEKNRTEVNRTEEEEKATASAVPQSLVDLYQNNIAPITSIVLESMSDWLKDMPEDVIAWAIKEAVSNNKRSWRYIEAILRNHHSAGRTTLQAIKSGQRKHKSGGDLQFNDDSNIDYDELERIMREKM